MGSSTGGLVVSIVNQKGGVGKSVSATNLAACLADRSKKILFIDADYQGNGSTQLGVKSKAIKSRKFLSMGLIEGTPASSLIVNSDFPNLNCIVADPELCEFNARRSYLPTAPSIMRKWLSEIKDDYDYIVVDTHPELGLMFQNVMVASDYYIIPLFAEPESVEGLHLIFNHIGLIQEELNRTLTLLGCLITKYDKDIKTHQNFLQEIEDFGKKKGMPVIGIIPLTKALATASANRIPMSRWKKHLPVSKAYEKLADSVIANVKPFKKGRVAKTPAISKRAVDGFMESVESSLGIEISTSAELDI